MRIFDSGTGALSLGPCACDMSLWPPAEVRTSGEVDFPIDLMMALAVLPGMEHKWDGGLILL